MSAATIRDVEGLVRAGLVAPEARDAAERVADRYAVALPSAMADLIDPSDSADPIARQFLPNPLELDSLPQELADPIGDEAHSPVEGVVHRYPDRVLLKLLHACPVYCRFCFRRESVGPGGPAVLSPASLDRALAYIRSAPSIWEVILTGGDPLALAPRRLRDIVGRLGSIGHVRVLRVHTRAPLADPTLVSDALVAALRAARQTVWIAVHANHPREFTESGRRALARLAEAGFGLVSQTVLLRGVNDDAETLAALMRLFVENRVKPYYLHHPDLAPGTSHFRLSLEEGRALARTLRGRLSGLAQPLYVLDIPGGFGKVPVGPIHAHRREGGAYAVEDWRGLSHAYGDPSNPKKT